MSDLYDFFNGAANALLTGHAPDSANGSWGPAGNTLTLDGSGSLYWQTPIPTGFGSGDFVTWNTWTPPSANYAVSAVVGAAVRNASFPTNGGVVGLVLRASGTRTASTFYGVYVTPGTTDVVNCYLFTISGGVLTGATPVGTQGGALGSQLAAGDVLTGSITTVSGQPQITLYKNGSQVFQGTDASGSPILSANSAGLICGCVASLQDILRGMWAGAAGSGPPGITIAPTNPAVNYGATQNFTLSTAFTGETFSWSATHGSISGSAATETYTAPGSGSTDTVTGSSIDLPGRSASTGITLQSGSATAFTLTGPASGYIHNASANFTFTPTGGLYFGSINPTMTSLAGSWSPSSLTWNNTNTAQTSRFTPSALGTGSANGSSSPSLTPPSSVSYLSNAQTLSLAPGAIATSNTTTVTFSGGGTLWLSSAPTFTPSGVTGVSCGSITVQSNTLATAPVTTGVSTGNVTWTDSTTSATAFETVAAVANILSIATGFSTGLSTVGYEVYDSGGASQGSWTSTGVTEKGTGSGDYGALVAIPADGHFYEIRWSASTDTTAPYAHDVVRAPDPSAAAIASAAASAILVNPSILLKTVAGGLVELDLSATVTRSGAPESIADCLQAARAQGFGAWSITGGTTLTLFASDGTTIVRQFTLGGPSNAPTSRA